MKINYFRQSWSSIKQEPVVSAVSLAGTALAIFLIMVVVMIEEVKTAPFAPESNRDRWLVQKYASITNDSWGVDNSSNGGMGFNLVKQVFYRMEIPEAVTAYTVTPSTVLFSVPGQASFCAEELSTDAGFWKVMNFTFISGKPYTQEDFEAGLPVAVLSESTARRLFQTSDAAGREFQLNYVTFRVAGVVKDVSNLATASYAQAWIPFTSTSTADFSWCDYMGPLSVTILPRDEADVPAIREEYDRLFAELGDEAKINGWKFILRERPYTQEVTANTPWASVSPDMSGVYRRRIITYLILLLVPAVNLSSMTHSRLRRRAEEIGVRRAFGARRSVIMTDIFLENLIITLFAGMFGLLLSLGFGLIFGGTVFAPGFGTSIESTGISLRILFHWSTFGWTMLFCFLLNLLSAGLPALNASRINIVNALTGKR